MEVLFLGTGAADFSPLVGDGSTDLCDKSIRRCSSVLIDGKYLVDCGPHTLGALSLSGIKLSGITDLFITHFHADHYDKKSVEKLCCDVPGLTVHFWEEAAITPSCPNTVRHKIGKEYTSGEMTVTAYAANHTAFPVHYLFSGDGKKFFYGCDGAWLLTDTYYALKNVHLDLLVLDGTVGDYTGDYRASEHNSIPMIRLLLPSLMTFGAIDNHTRIILSHIARTLNPDYETLSEILKKDDMLAAYDGMRILL